MATEPIQTAGQRLATPPSRRRPGNALNTTVARSWFWVPFDDDGRGGWRLIPDGMTHRSRLIEVDHTDASTIVDKPYYESKGFIPRRDIANDDPRLALLPTNHDAMRRDHRLQAVMPADLDKHLAAWRKNFDSAA